MPDPQTWALEYAPRAARALRRLDRVPARQILTALERLATMDDPTKVMQGTQRTSQSKSKAT